MARTELSHKEFTRAGVTITADTAADTSNGNVTVNDGEVVVVAENTGTTSATLTTVIPGSLDGIDHPDRQEDLAAGALEAFGPYPVSVYGRSLGIDASATAVNLSVYHLG